MSPPITRNTTVVAVREQASANVEGEAVILNLTDGAYYGLDRTGGRIWALLQEPRTVAELTTALRSEFDVGEERCERDLLALLRELAARRLIRIENAGARGPQ